jgi:hypothetical protein
MKKTLIPLIAFWFFSTITYSQVNPLVQSVINQVSLDSLSNFVRELSGEIPVNINGVVDTIRSRHSNQPGNNLAADYIEQKLESFGLTVYNQNYSTNGRNVYAEQIGSDYPEQRYIICAHYDDMPPGPIAPGADDNASGTAAVLEAARLLSNYNSKYSIVYALWDEEEQGLLGSQNYVYQALATNEDIQGVINIDMIGWDSDNDMKLWVNTRDTANSVYISDMTVQVNTSYQIGLDPQILNPGSGSDNLVFWYFGFSAIGVEELYGIDWNDYYHTTEDKIDKFNLPYFHRCAKMVIGTLATLAELSPSSTINSESDIVHQYLLLQNYPNPFNPNTTIRYQIPEKSFISLKVYDLLGNEIAILTNEEKPAGTYEVEFDISSVSGSVSAKDGYASGVYFYRLQVYPANGGTGSFIETKKMLLLR